MLIRVFGIILLAAVMAACTKPPLSLEVWNTSGERIYQVEVWYDDRHVDYGVIPSGKSGARHEISRQPPDVVEIRWIDSSDKPVTVRVNISGLIPGVYKDGKLMFKIEPGNLVTAYFDEMSAHLY